MVESEPSAPCLDGAPSLRLAPVLVVVEVRRSQYSNSKCIRSLCCLLTRVSTAHFDLFINFSPSPFVDKDKLEQWSAKRKTLNWKGDLLLCCLLHCYAIKVDDLVFTTYINNAVQKISGRTHVERRKITKRAFSSYFSHRGLHLNS